MNPRNKSLFNENRDHALNSKDTEYMKKSSSSSITLTGGTNTARPVAGWSIPAAVGGASEGLVRGFAVDLKPIRVNLVHPGAIRTELVEGLLKV